MFIITCVTIFANIMSGVVYGVVSDVVLNGVPNGAGAPNGVSPVPNGAPKGVIIMPYKTPNHNVNNVDLGHRDVNVHAWGDRSTK